MFFWSLSRNDFLAIWCWFKLFANRFDFISLCDSAQLESKNLKYMDPRGDHFRKDYEQLEVPEVDFILRPGADLALQRHKRSQHETPGPRARWFKRFTPGPHFE